MYLKNIHQLFIILCYFFMISPVMAEKINLLETLELKNAKNYTEKYITGGQPSVKDLTLLAKHGVKTVINLRTKKEFTQFDEKKIVESLGMKYISIPVAGKNGINQQNLTLFNQALGQNKNKTLVHCASGNRVGAFFALDAFNYKGKSATEAMIIGKKTGLTRLAPTIKSQLTGI